MSTDDEWTTVTKADKKRIFRNTKNHRGRGGGKSKHAPPINTTKEELSVAQITKYVDELITEIPNSNFYQNLVSQLDDAKKNKRIIIKIVCYGIGNFSTSSASQWQLACILSVWKKLNQPQQDSTRTSAAETPATTTTNTSDDDDDDAKSRIQQPRISMEYYDPCTTQSEIICLERQGIKVLKVNERGQKEIHNSDDDDENNKNTFFYMPHCPLSLYTNVIYTNWNHLHQVLIYGNSLTAYANRLVVNKHVRLLKLIVDKSNAMIETPMPIGKDDIQDRSGHFEQAFNDSSIIAFKTEPPTLPTEKPSFFTTESDDADETI